MLCSECSAVKHGTDGIQAVSLRCRSWTCPLCIDSRKAQLVALAKSGKPTTFITLTVNPEFGETPYERARMLADAWRKIVREVKKKYGYTTLPYFCVFEATKHGEPHLHILCRVKWISQKWLSQRMGEIMLAPIVDIRRVRDVKKLAYYVAKYCGKDPHRFETCKRYWTTRDYEVDTYEPQQLQGTWDSKWTVVRTPLAELADVWRSQGREVEGNKFRIWAMWTGCPEDVVGELEYIYSQREKGLAW